MKTMVLAMTLAGVLGAASSIHAQCTVPPLARFGPIDPVNGFPQYYMDSEGTALAPCLNFVCDPALGLPDPNLPVSFPGNFPEEFFYHRAISTLAGPGVMKATLVLALEGAFVNGAPAAGDQMVFARTRVTIIGATPGGVYTVTHPYGVATVTADTLGNGRFNQDVGLVPGAFGAALNGGIGPFLHFLAGPVPPAPRNIGTSLADQTVTGSPCGTNLFRIEGTGLPVGGVQTDKFGTLIGELAVLCGNGVLEPGEQCDDHNNIAGDCCSPTCTFEPAGSPCEDGNVCTTNSTCDGAGVCGVTGFPVVPCTDGNICTIGDMCSAGVCTAGPPPTCPPGAVVEADTYVDANSATTNFGARTTVFVDGSPQRQGLYRVRVSGVAPGSLTKAILRLNVASVERAGTSGGRIHLASCAWAERTVTWNTRPAFNALALDSKAAVNQGQTVDFDVTPVVTGDGLYCFTIDSANANGVQYQSRESATGRPQLLITSSCCGVRPPAAPRCGDNIVNQPTEQCDGLDSAVCPGQCLANCTCPAACTPTTCAAQGKNCGTIPDGCGGTLTCGACVAPQICGGGGVANVCGGGVIGATATLTLTATGRGGEVVFTTPAGLRVTVGSTGSATFTAGTSITLQATNARDVIWSGLCNSGGVKTKTCTFTLNANGSETANVQ